MTIQQTVRNGLSRRSKHDQHWVKPAGERPKDPVNRQHERRSTLGLAANTVDRSMPRAERRKLARAIAAGWWRQEVKERAEKAAA